MCSRLAALAFLFVALVAMRLGGGRYAFLAIAVGLAYESNRRPVTYLVRWVAVAVQWLGLLGVVVLVVLIGGIAESGRRHYEYEILLWLVMAVPFFLGAVAAVGGTRTLGPRGE